MSENRNIKIILFEIITTIIALPLTWLAVNPLCKGLGLNYQYTQTVNFTASLLVALLLTKIFYGTSFFDFPKVYFDKPILVYGWLGFVGAIGAFVSTLGEVDLQPTLTIFIGYVLMNLMIAISEEVVFRRLYIGLLIEDKININKKNLWFAVIVAAVIFGLRHLINLMLYPNQIVTCSFQVLSTFCAAFYLTGMYLVCGSLVPGIVIHFLEDFAVSAMEMYSSKTLLDSTLDASVFQGLGMVILQIPYVICGIVMINQYLKKLEDKKSTSSSIF
ncbi:MAG: CPBP family intramembrane metalloprotease [Erysipelotrichaceae bacterium]|nr:CPBP family intramembrane metalloprotease [Erysipelotrichaceae bacterium]